MMLSLAFQIRALWRCALDPIQQFAFTITANSRQLQSVGVENFLRRNFRMPTTQAAVPQELLDNQVAEKGQGGDQYLAYE